MLQGASKGYLSLKVTYYYILYLCLYLGIRAFFSCSHAEREEREERGERREGEREERRERERGETMKACIIDRRSAGIVQHTRMRDISSSERDMRVQFTY